MARSTRQPLASRAAARLGRRPSSAPRLGTRKGLATPSVFTVKNLLDSGAGSLREAVQYANAHANTTIKFAPPLHGTIKLTCGELAITQSTIIDGPGAHRLVVSGRRLSRVFTISSDATVTISGLTITRGLADEETTDDPSLGGGVLNRGNLTLEEVVVSHNRAAGAANATLSVGGRQLSGAAAGGGVANLGTLTVSDSTFEKNQARGASGSSEAAGKIFPGTACGGGLASFGTATATVTDCRFTGNLAHGGDGCTSASTNGIAGDAGGGAIASFGSFASAPKTLAKLEVNGSHFSNNKAIGGNGNVCPVLPGHSFGGAIASHRFNGGAELKVSKCTFDHNQAIGGDHNVVTKVNDRGVPNMAAAGSVFACGTGTIGDSTFDHNRAIGGEGIAGTNGIPITLDGGNGQGGGISFAFKATKVTISNCKVKHNVAIGGQAGAGGNGGSGRGGGVFNAPDSTTDVTASSITHNLAIGASGSNGGDGGNGQGGGFYNAGTASLGSDTIEFNKAKAGAADSGGSPGTAEGGGVYNAAGATISLVGMTAIFGNKPDDEFGC